jgi:hypothetical protein
VFRISHLRCRARRIGRIDEDGNTGHCRHELTQELQPFRHQFADENIGAREVASRPGEAGDESELDGVFRNHEHDWNCRGRRLGGDGRGGAAGRNDHRDPLANQIDRQPGQQVEPVVGPAVFDRDVLALDIAVILQALAESAQAFRETVRRYSAEEADDRHWLLRADGARPKSG